MWHPYEYCHPYPSNFHSMPLLLLYTTENNGAGADPSVKLPCHSHPLLETDGDQVLLAVVK